MTGKKTGVGGGHLQKAGQCLQVMRARSTSSKVGQRLVNHMRSYKKDAKTIIYIPVRNTFSPFVSICSAHCSINPIARFAAVGNPEDAKSSLKLPFFNEALDGVSVSFSVVLLNRQTPAEMLSYLYACFFAFRRPDSTQVNLFLQNFFMTVQHC